MKQLPVKPGIDGLPTSLIPTDPSAFIDWFKNSFIPRWAANADIRNATPGAGVQIGGTLDTPGFVGFEAIAGNSVLGNPTGVKGDVQAITAGADGQFLQRSAGALVFGAIASADSIAGAGITASPLELVNDSAAPGISQYYGTNVGGTKGFFALPASGGSTITTLTQTGGASQVYNIPASAHVIEVILIGGGGGGGSGAKGTAPGTQNGGGGGGSGGGISTATFPAALLPSSVTVSFSNAATGSNGGVASVVSGNGHSGVIGSDVSFGVFLIARGGGNGILGTAGGTGGTGGVTGQGRDQSGTSGGGGGAAAGATAGGTISAGTLNISCYAPTGGGGGGGLTGVAVSASAAGGTSPISTGFVTVTPGAAGGTGLIGGTGSDGMGQYPAAGGGGGGASLTVSGGAGGPGGNFGAGGGGGAACTNTAPSSGAGGQGGLAACIIIAY